MLRTIEVNHKAFIRHQNCMHIYNQTPKGWRFRRCLGSLPRCNILFVLSSTPSVFKHSFWLSVAVVVILCVLCVMAVSCSCQQLSDVILYV